jgi:hypothetical protein
MPRKNISQATDNSHGFQSWKQIREFLIKWGSWANPSTDDAGPVPVQPTRNGAIEIRLAGTFQPGWEFHDHPKRANDFVDNMPPRTAYQLSDRRCAGSSANRFHGGSNGSGKGLILHW